MSKLGLCFQLHSCKYSWLYLVPLWRYHSDEIWPQTDRQTYQSTQTNSVAAPATVGASRTTFAMVTHTRTHTHRQAENNTSPAVAAGNSTISTLTTEKVLFPCRYIASVRANAVLMQSSSIFLYFFFFFLLLCLFGIFLPPELVWVLWYVCLSVCGQISSLW